MVSRLKKSGRKVLAKADSYKPSSATSLSRAAVSLIVIVCVIYWQQVCVTLLERSKTSESSSEKADSFLQSSPETRTLRIVGAANTNKSRLVLHVGPPKSASTSLQTDFTLLQDTLKVDGYEYKGRTYSKFTSAAGKKSLKRVDSDVQRIGRHMFKHCHQTPRKKCAEGFVRELNNILNNTKHCRNVIISDEAYALWTEKDVLALREALNDTWEVLVVIGYRRIFDWLPSTKFQRERVDRWGAFKSNWPGPGRQGKQLEPLFPGYIQKWRDYHIYTDALVEIFQKEFAVSILNLYEKTTIRTTFLCKILLDTPNACNASRQLDKQQGETHVNDHDDAPSSFYDAVATTAAARGLINIDVIERRFVLCDIRKHQQEVLNQGPFEFPLICPSENELDRFLNESLRMEADLLGENERNISDHIESFRMKVACNAFCWVDSEAVLDMEVWQSYFARFSNPEYTASIKYGWRCEKNS